MDDNLKRMDSLKVKSPKLVRSSFDKRKLFIKFETFNPQTNE